ncbi:MAG: hypothetical protein IKL33_03110 [Alphaproteobacteria bacterium]|nr:hypothetical protein [Alphaproteobacteria bacterium]
MSLVLLGLPRAYRIADRNSNAKILSNGDDFEELNCLTTTDVKKHIKKIDVMIIC